MKSHTMTPLKSILIFSLATWVISCSKDENRGLEGSGRILDAETMQPVDSALVSMYAPSENGGEAALAQQVYTNHDGWFYFAQGSEDLKDNKLDISKPPYYLKSDKLTFRGEVSDFLLYPKSILKLVPKISNPSDKNWMISLRMGEFENTRSYSTKSNTILYIPLNGGALNRIEVRFSVSHQVVDASFYDITIPFRDTLELEFIRNI